MAGVNNDTVTLAAAFSGTSRCKEVDAPNAAACKLLDGTHVEEAKRVVDDAKGWTKGVATVAVEWASGAAAKRARATNARLTELSTAVSNYEAQLRSRPPMKRPELLTANMALGVIEAEVLGMPENTSAVSQLQLKLRATRQELNAQLERSSKQLARSGPSEQLKASIGSGRR